MAAVNRTGSGKVVPARLAFLAIYNPTFGGTDETAYEQIFFYYSRDEWDQRRQPGEGRTDSSAATGHEKNTARVHNERLRQVGLARGMVEFANNFSDGMAVDSIETEKSRIVLKELEPGWWVLASVDLTRLPRERRKEELDSNAPGSTVEYSAREVAPAHLLLRQLQQAHSLFLLHHGVSAAELLQGMGRKLFTDVLERFWNQFAWGWDVLLHGNPAADIYNALKLSSGGELGIGVGEEDWGSGERDVLEDFVHRTDGLIDLMVARYGDAPAAEPGGGDKESAGAVDTKPWLDTGDDPRASDGIVFTGVGNVSRRSLATVSQWMDAIFRHGEHAYGLGENPSSRPRIRGRRGKPRQRADTVKSTRAKSEGPRRKGIEDVVTHPGIPPPLVIAAEESLDAALKNLEQRESSKNSRKETESIASTKTVDQDRSYFDGETMMKVLKMGYGSAWTLNPRGFQKTVQAEQDDTDNGQQPAAAPGQAEHAQSSDLAVPDSAADVSDSEADKEKAFVQHVDPSIGRFLIGLPGDLENPEFDADLPDSGESLAVAGKPIQRRTITVELISAQTRDGNAISPAPKSSDVVHNADSHLDHSTPDQTVFNKVRVVVYAHQPFIFTFLFDAQTPSLAIPSFYRSIHHQLGPLQKPLLRSTDPARMPERVLSLLSEKVREGSAEIQSHNLYDLIHDPVKMTVRTSIPNIPTPGTLAAEGFMPSSAAARTVSGGAWYTLGIPIGAAAKANNNTVNGGALLHTHWSRVEALNVHTQILNTWAATRAPGTTTLDPNGDLEQTVKTARGWWVAWLRIVAAGSQPAKSLSLSFSSSSSISIHPRPDSSATLKQPNEHEYEHEHDHHASNVQQLRPPQAKEAFLIRKSDATTAGQERHSRTKTSSRSPSPAAATATAAATNWLLLRDHQGRDASGASTVSAAGPTTARAVIEGVGVDARRWVEALSKLA